MTDLAKAEFSDEEAETIAENLPDFLNRIQQEDWRGFSWAERRTIARFLRSVQEDIEATPVETHTGFDNRAH